MTYSESNFFFFARWYAYSFSALGCDFTPAYAWSFSIDQDCIFFLSAESSVSQSAVPTIKIVPNIIFSLQILWTSPSDAVSTVEDITSCLVAGR